MSTLKAIRDFSDPSLSYNKETACFLEGDNKRILSLSTSNNPVAVAFDWGEIWPKIKELEHYPDEFSMIHTHPPGMENMSSVDRNMVHGWVQGLGRPIWFAIICEEKYHLYYCQKIDGKVKIEDLGFVKIGNGIRHGEMLQMVMRGISQGTEDYFLDGIVQEMNSIMNSGENPVPVWPANRMEGLSLLSSLLREVEILNRSSGVAERITWCQTIAATMMDDDFEKNQHSLIRFLNDKAWGL